MGADIHGGVYGMFVEGSEFGIYSKGPIYSSSPAVQLQETGEPARAVLYTSTSADVMVMASGRGMLVGGSGTVTFDNTFTKVVSVDSPLIITVTPAGNTSGVYDASSGTSGFTVKENNGGTSNVSFSWIAIGTRRGYEHPQVAEDVVSAGFESKIREGLHNDADLSTNGSGLYHSKGQLMVGPSPPPPADKKMAGKRQN